MLLFNSNQQALAGEFVLNEESIGLSEGQEFSIEQIHPVGSEQKIFDWNDTVKWTVPAETALVLEIKPT